MYLVYIISGCKCDVLQNCECLHNLLTKNTQRVSMLFPMICMQFAIVRNAITDLYSVIHNQLTSHYKPDIRYILTIAVELV